MNKKRVIIGMLSVILFTISVGICFAQVPEVPAPTCVSVPGIPCPGDVSMPSNKPVEQSTAQPLDINENISKLFNYLITNINKIISDIIEGIRSIFDGLRK